MGRNVVAHGTPDRSFAGLMDHLTGFSREGAPDSDSDFGATFRRTSKPDSEFIDGSLTNPRNGARAMLPVTERKPGRAALPTEAAALSYERALQIHGRRRSPPAAPALQTTPAAQTQQIASASRVDAPVGSRKAASPSKTVAAQLKVVEEPPKSGASPARSGARSNSQIPRSAKPPVAPPIQIEGGNRRTQATLDTGAKANLAPGVLSKKTAGASFAPGSAEKPARRVSAHVAEVHDASQSRRRGKTPGKAHREVREKTVSATPRSERSQNRAAERDALIGQIHPLESAIELIESASPGGQLELLQAFSQLDQRRTIVSVRLTEGEFACLRNRAEESGISVSAYMRSCVVDADQLRAQVKRALAEMRSLSASASTEPGAEPGTALTASGLRPSNSNGWNTRGWFRLVLRPLASLFGPLFPVRRSA